MSWSTAAEVATTVGTAVALVGVFVSSTIAVRSEKLTRAGQAIERKQAASAAARAEAAAALTEEYTLRVVDALETMASLGRQDGHSGLRARVRWALVHQSGDTYRLDNVGELAARSVAISADPTLGLINVPDSPTIGAGEAVTFMAAIDFGTVDTTITVAWDDDVNSKVRSTWRYPLPSRPSR